MRTATLIILFAVLLARPATATETWIDMSDGSYQLARAHGPFGTSWYTTWQDQFRAQGTVRGFGGPLAHRDAMPAGQHFRWQLTMTSGQCCGVADYFVLGFSCDLYDFLGVDFTVSRVAPGDPADGEVVLQGQIPDIFLAECGDPDYNEFSGLLTFTGGSWFDDVSEAGVGHRVFFQGQHEYCPITEPFDYSCPEGSFDAGAYGERIVSSDTMSWGVLKSRP